MHHHRVTTSHGRARKDGMGEVGGGRREEALDGPVRVSSMRCGVVDKMGYI